MKKILNKIEKEINEHAGEKLTCFQLGLALKVFEDRLWGIDDESAQRCNELQDEIFN